MLGSRLLFDSEPNTMALLGSSALIVIAVDTGKRRSQKKPSRADRTPDVASG